MQNEQQLCHAIEEKREELSTLIEFIYNHPEVAMEETESSACLEQYLQTQGFEIEQGIAGLATAFRASWQSGEGGPSIGFLCEYDALEMGHGCAHHLQGPIISVAAAVLKNAIATEGIPCKLVIYGTPAEEDVGGKVIMAREGCFRDIDIALMVHAGPATQVDVKSMAMTNTDFFFVGKAAHPDLCPEIGRSAVDAMMLFCNGLEFMREHIPDDVKMSYYILNGGGSSYAVPASAALRVAVNCYRSGVRDEVVARIKKAAQGAAMMTETECEIYNKESYEAKIPNDALNNLIMLQAAKLSAPNIQPPRQRTGATDFGDVLQLVPGAVLRFQLVPEGTPSHSAEFLNAGIGKHALDSSILAAKIIAVTGAKLVEDKSVFDQVRQEFASRKAAQQLGT